MGEAKARKARGEEVAKIYQLRVTLEGSEPPIWRRIQLAGDTTLARLHQILQIAMGWEDDHLHEFSAGGRSFGAGDPMRAAPGERNARLRRVAPSVGDTLYYEYDFGDDWRHEIVVEEILPPKPRVRYPRCTEAERACPPEDSGGIWGYEHKLEILNDPDHPDHELIVDWMGEDFDPEAVDVEAINRRLARVRPPS